MRLLLLLLGALPLAASAHVGADAAAHHGFNAGLLHPFTGLDHLAAMLAVGAWGGLHAGTELRRAWLAPLAFAAMVGAGALLAHAGWVLPAIEPMIAASLLVIGLVLGSRLRLGIGPMAVIAGGFALFHGAAHGIELAGATALGGMLLGTLVLHAAGIAAGRASRAPWLERAAGLGVAAFGVALLVPLLP